MPKKADPADRQRAQALYAIGRTYREISKDLAGRISPQTINNWARADNWQKGLLPETLVTPDTPQVYEAANATPEEVSANTDKLQEANRRRWVDQKAEMAGQFADKIQLLMERAFSPCVVKEQKVVAVGGGVQEVRLVETELTLPPPADQVKLITGIAILVDKASLLVGDATARVETANLTPEQAVDRYNHVKSEFERRRQAELDAAEKRRNDAAQNGVG